MSLCSPSGKVLSETSFEQNKVKAINHCFSSKSKKSLQSKGKRSTVSNNYYNLSSNYCVPDTMLRALRTLSPLTS